MGQGLEQLPSMIPLKTSTFCPVWGKDRSAVLRVYLCGAIEVCGHVSCEVGVCGWVTVCVPGGSKLKTKTPHLGCGEKRENKFNGS